MKHWHISITIIAQLKNELSTLRLNLYLLSFRYEQVERAAARHSTIATALTSFS